MQKIIDQILAGDFDYESGSLDFSCTKIEFAVPKGGQYEDSFRIYAPEGAAGMVLSSDWRMECLTEEFSGEQDQVAFRFHGEKLEEGDVVKGTFDIISDRGEYYLPFVASVEHVMPESSVGTVKNLFHFANLAKSDWKEAVKLFYSPEFLRIFSGSDARYLEDYRALSAYRGQEQNVEEFLIQVNKKQPQEFTVEEAALDVELPAYGPDAVTEHALTVLRSGWGFTRLFVEYEGEFLFTEKEVLTDDDFLGNRFRLPVFIDSGRCRRGRNFGRIRLYNSFVDLTVPVTVARGGAPGTGEAERMRCTVRLMEFYQAFRLRRLSTAVWLKETGKLVERMVAMDEGDISARLLQAQLLITEERYNEAGWILDHVAEVLEKSDCGHTLTAYYLYLTTLIHGEEDYVERVAGEVERLFKRDDSNWRVGWLLMYLSEEYCRSDRERWAFWEDLFRKGCTSPVLYIEALSQVRAAGHLVRGQAGGAEAGGGGAGAVPDRQDEGVFGANLCRLDEAVREKEGCTDSAGNLYAADQGRKGGARLFRLVQGRGGRPAPDYEPVRAFHDVPEPGAAPGDPQSGAEIFFLSEQSGLCPYRVSVRLYLPAPGEAGRCV